jgi:polyisoprenoid-binding protein YceI
LLRTTTGDAAPRAASIVSGNDLRDERVRGADFLDAAAHPEIGFVSRRVEPAGEGAWRIGGDLTIAGTTRLVELRATDRSDRHPIRIRSSGAR